MGYLVVMKFTCEGKTLRKFIYSEINLNDEINLILLLPFKTNGIATDNIKINLLRLL